MPNVRINIQDFLPKQEEIAKAILSTPANETKFHIIRGGRQSSKSELLLRLLFPFIAVSNSNGGLVSASYRQYQDFLTKFIKMCPPEIIKSIEKGKDQITFINGTTLHFYTGNNPDAARGPSFDFLILDEAAHYSRGAIDIIVSTVAARPNAKVVMASTPKGRNDFWRYCNMAYSGTYAKEYILSYLDNPYYDRILVEEQRKSMSDIVFRQEFLGQFVFGKGSVFGEFSHLQKIKEWGQPIQGERYFGGLDISGAGDDKTVLTIYNCKGQIVFIYECKESRIPHQARELAPIIQKYDAEVYGEANGGWVTLVEELQDMGLKVYKFWMSNESKGELVAHTLRDIAEGAIVLPSVELCPELDNEMTTYEVGRTTGGKLTYSHPKGLHDDYVDSMLIGNWARYKLYFGGQSQVYDPKESLRDLNPTPTTLDIKIYDDIENLYD